MGNRLIALGGKLRSGKDEAAKYLHEKHGYTVMGMSDVLNDALLILNPWVRLDFAVIIEHPWETITRRGKFMKGEFIRYQELHSAVGYVEAKKHSDVREYLQLLGTEVGRNMISEDVWVELAERRIQDCWAAGEKVVITAMRFPNEIAMAENLYGTTVWLERSAEKRSEGLESSEGTRGTTEGENSATEASRGVSGHVSETSVSADDFNWVIDNNFGLEDLYADLDWLVDKT